MLKKRYYILLPILIACLTSLLVGLLVLRHMPLASDALAYHQEAGSILDGSQAGQPYYYPPGMSGYLAFWQRFLGSSIWVSRLAIVWTSAAGAGLVGWLTYQLTRSKRFSLAAGLIMAVYPPMVLLSGQPYPQHLAHVCVLGTCAFWLRALEDKRLHHFVFCGLFLGLGVLTRPASASLGLALAATGLAAAWRVRRDSPAETKPMIRLATGAAVCVTVFLLSLIPALCHNWSLGEGVTLSTNNERNLLLGNCPYTPLYKTSHLAQRTFKDLPPAVSQYLNPLYIGDNPRLAMRREAVHQIVEAPGTFILRTLNRTRSFWGFDYLATRRIQAWCHAGKQSMPWLLVLEAGSYIVIMLAAIAGFASNRIRHKGFMLLFVFSYQIPYCLAFSGGTYHFPVVGLLIPFAAVGISHLFTLFRKEGLGQVLTRNRWVWVAWIVFLLIQIEYAYFTWKHL